MTTQKTATQSLACFPPTSFVGILDQLTLAFEPFPTVAELMAAIDRANACDAPELPEKPIVPIWEEPDWIDPIAWPVQEPDNVCQNLYVDDLTYNGDLAALAARGDAVMARIMAADLEVRS
jgi:hypothetical protein